MGLWFKLDCWYRARRYYWRRDAMELRHVVANLRPGDHAIDVGGYSGGYTHWMRKAVGKTGRVVVFEPVPAKAAHLRRMASEFGWRNVEVEEVGLSAAPGELTLRIPKGKPSAIATLETFGEGEHYEFRVRITTLDDVVRAKGLDRLRYIKIDVEGHELDVLKGGMETLRRQRPSLLVECIDAHRPGCTAELLRLMGSLGYDARFVEGKQYRPASEFDLAVHQPPGLPLVAVNFLFEPAEMPTKERRGA